MTVSSWKPDRPSSKGAQMYHSAVITTTWYENNLKPLIGIIKTKLNNHDDIVVDFGAGTGVSALFMLKNINSKLKLLLVDNSPAWLAKAYEELRKYSKVQFYILAKKENKYSTLEKTIGNEKAHIVVSANTIHLIPDIKEVFRGIYLALKPNGHIVLQSGNIKRQGRLKGILMIDDTVNKVHEEAIRIIKKDDYFLKYRKGLNQRLKSEFGQRKFIFPDPRPLMFYIAALKKVGFTKINAKYKRVKVKYSDWMRFLRIRRIQAGILPEIGSRSPTLEEENDRDLAITFAIKKVFKDLKRSNPTSTSRSFTAEWVYIIGKKPAKT